MNTRLIMIEGIPGSGKTTIAGKINGYLRENNIATHLYQEDDYSPTDLKWHAVMTRNEYDRLLQKYSDIAAEISKNTVFHNGQPIVSYNKIICLDQEFYREMEGYEIYNGKLPLQDFCSILQIRWSSFAKEASQKEELTIFENALLQSQVNDLLAIHTLDDQTIYSYLNRLVDPILSLNPVLIYLCAEDVEETIRHIAQERSSVNGQPSWLEMAKHWVQWSPYGKLHGLTGYDGVVAFCSERKRVELGFLHATPLRSLVVRVNRNYDTVFEEIKDFLNIVI